MTAKVLFEECEKASLITEMPAKDPPSATVQLLEWVGDPAIVSRTFEWDHHSKADSDAVYGVSRAIVQSTVPWQRSVSRGVRFCIENQSLMRRKRRRNMNPAKKCNDVGYYGQVAMLELLEMTPDMRALIATNPDASAIRCSSQNKIWSQFRLMLALLLQKVKHRLRKFSVSSKPISS